LASVTFGAAAAADGPANAAAAPNAALASNAARVAAARAHRAHSIIVAYRIRWNSSRTLLSRTELVAARTDMRTKNSVNRKMLEV
jgi:hypothetical protein